MLDTKFGDDPLFLSKIWWKYETKWWRHRIVLFAEFDNIQSILCIPFAGERQLSTT